MQIPDYHTTGVMCIYSVQGGAEPLQPCQLPVQIIIIDPAQTYMYGACACIDSGQLISQ